MLQEVDWGSESPEAAWPNWLRARGGPEALIVQNLCGWEGHDANLWRQLDPQVFGLYGFAKAEAQTTLPAKDLANVKIVKLLREA